MAISLSSCATAGVLAIALTYSGMLGKVYAEILESGEYEKLKASPKAERCRWQSAILVYKRLGSTD